MKKWILITASLFVTWSTITNAATSAGKVDFATSCNNNVQQTFNHAMAQIHNMMYVQANEEFTKITKEDPNCAMAYWGVALSYVHPLWDDQPSNEMLAIGQAALQKAASMKSLSKRELDYINALQSYYQDYQKTSDQQRIANWAQAQKQLHEQYPNDADATALYALMLLATAPKDDKTYSKQQQAGAILEELNKKFPEHPATYHYTIHAYDNPKLAAKGEKYARGYDKIAPDVPHALHMPSHIFVRLGHWPETVQWNIRSAKAALNQPLADGKLSMHYAHALDYLMYAYLQQGDFAEAKNVLTKIDEIKNIQATFPTAYGLAAAKARFYLAQQLWKQAANIPLDKPKGFPWDKFPNAKAILVFARGFGALQLGENKQGLEAIAELQKIHQQLLNMKQNYWATLTEVKLKILQSSMALTADNEAKALSLMKQAADLEDSMDKHPVTPGEVLPARELYGDMLYALGKYKQALDAYKQSLAISPNRFQSLYGAGLSAEALKDKKAALGYYKQLVSQSVPGSENTKELNHAKAYLK